MTKKPWLSRKKLNRAWGFRMLRACDFAKDLVHRSRSNAPFSKGPFPAVHPFAVLVGRRFERQQVLTDPYHAELPKLLLGVGIWLRKGFTRFAISVILGASHLTSKANYLVVAYLIGLDKHAAERGLGVSCQVALASRRKGVIDFAECQPGEGIRGCKGNKGRL